MTEETKAIICFLCLIAYFAILGLILDYFMKREVMRQFYKDLLRLIILYENNSMDVFIRELPKVLGTRIVRYSSYEKVMNDIIFVFNSSSTGYQTVLAYALSLHRSYCISTRELKKYKNKLLKESDK